MAYYIWNTALNAESPFDQKLVYNLKILPLRFKKAGRVWCCGARETHWATCHNGVTPIHTKDVPKSPRFFRSSWYLIMIFIYIFLYAPIYFNSYYTKKKASNLIFPISKFCFWIFFGFKFQRFSIFCEMSLKNFGMMVKNQISGIRIPHFCPPVLLMQNERFRDDRIGIFRINFSFQLEI